jgi:transposase
MGGDRNGKFDDDSEGVLALLVFEHPDATREELTAMLVEDTKLDVSTSAVQRALERLDLTRKKRRSTRTNKTPNV